MQNVEELRLSYKPDKAKVLFIGESPPASGDFFYYGGKNETLFKHTRIAFREAYKQECGEGEEFLRFFKYRGCYLDDLCLDPINDKPNNERVKLRRDSIPSLSKRIKEMQPESVIIIMKAIREYVEKALEQSGLDMTNRLVYTSSFPTGNKRNINDFIQVVKQALCELE